MSEPQTQQLHLTLMVNGQALDAVPVIISPDIDLVTISQMHRSSRHIPQTRSDEVLFRRQGDLFHLVLSRPWEARLFIGMPRSVSKAYWSSSSEDTMTFVLDSPGSRGTVTFAPGWTLHFTLTDPLQRVPSSEKDEGARLTTNPSTSEQRHVANMLEVVTTALVLLGLAIMIIQHVLH